MIPQLIMFSLTFLGSLFMETKMKSFSMVELAILGFLFLLGVVMTYRLGYNLPTGWGLSLTIFSLLLANLVLLVILTRAYGTFLLSTFFCLLGFIRAQGHTEEPHETGYEEQEVTEPEKVETVPLYTSVVMKPKKDYVASSDGGKYHTRDCHYAKRIENRVLFKNKKDAQKKGYTQCSCVRK